MPVVGPSSRRSLFTVDGTLAYLFTFGSRFRLIFLDSAGAITEEERSLLYRSPICLEVTGGI